MDLHKVAPCGKSKNRRVNLRQRWLANATFAFSLLLSFDNFQHIWSDSFAELSTFSESSTNNRFAFRIIR